MMGTINTTTCELVFCEPKFIQHSVQIPSKSGIFPVKKILKIFEGIA
jgi:hypothetical protein